MITIDDFFSSGELELDVTPLDERIEEWFFGGGSFTTTGAVIHGSSRTYSAEGLKSALQLKSFMSNFSNLRDTVSFGMAYVPRQIFLYSSASVAPLYGKHPFNNAYKRTADAQISAGGPAYSVFLTISGAMYDGVPQNILIFFSLGIQVEKPKSINFTLLFSSRSTFSSLMSLCVIHFL